ncbi:hypothetical protein FJV76_16945 [Mesorhizobium sp. WSM4303]|uniref:hypothetical protein n=1 Tax=unclassified Mesorhizobium TaxID=325217 RepID=UPI00115D99EB|nr:MULTISPECIES: hypothetical protein [unclassified Mesorhizobium]TRC99622.1 hypothetical protein FJV77_04120 [Mesorhizobium sp. WSM4306]TRD03231.1 hypothetical protein FJV76_16945 [Mesorhizobium sp. WSM4303]
MNDGDGTVGSTPFMTENSSPSTESYIDNLEQFESIDHFIRTTLKQANLGTETDRAVAHFLDAREFEMAFEGLFIDLFKSKRPPIALNLNECEAMARLLKLDENPTFDGDFWAKFETYIHAQRE